MFTLHQREEKKRCQEPLIRDNAPPGQGGTLQKEESYRYDAFDRRIGQTSTVGTDTTTYQFVWDGDHVRFVWTNTGTTPSNRYLHGPAIDQVLADEQLTGGAGRLWALTDHLGSVRDVVNAAGGQREAPGLRRLRPRDERQQPQPVLPVRLHRAGVRRGHGVTVQPGAVLRRTDRAVDQ